MAPAKALRARPDHGLRVRLQVLYPMLGAATGTYDPQAPHPLMEVLKPLIVHV